MPSGSGNPRLPASAARSWTSHARLRSCGATGKTLRQPPGPAAVFRLAPQYHRNRTTEDSCAAFGKRKQRNRPHEPRPPLSGGRRPPTWSALTRIHVTSRRSPQSPPLPARAGRPPLSIRDEVLRFAPAEPKPVVKPAATKRVGILARSALLTGMILAGTAVITLGLFGKLLFPGLEYPNWMISETTASIPAAKAAKPSQLQLASAVDHSLAFEMPETYGVYAVSEGHLTPLDPLPVRIPDARVAISSPVSKRGLRRLPTATCSLWSITASWPPMFRKALPCASWRKSCRRQRSSTASQRPPRSRTSGRCAGVRSISGLRRWPQNKEMILIRPADPAFTLSPGRYVLVFRNQAYDFSVAGTVTDTAQCLERSDLQDRSVYSECRELPDAAKS